MEKRSLTLIKRCCTISREFPDDVVRFSVAYTGLSMVTKRYVAP
jgi:hypothetical protein